MISLLTVFTPTYNRAYILPELYRSLCLQSNKEFEWLIVDDGSTDNTSELVKSWQSQGILTIRYIFQTNGGKMRAHNLGVKSCNTELFFCVDSDDFLETNSIQYIRETWDEIKHKSDISGIVAYKGFVDDPGLIRCEFPTEMKISTLLNLYANGFSGDTSLIYRMEILKQYLFPEIEGEKFITEAYIYNQIDENYKLLILPKPLIMCKYQPDGYTQNANKLFVENPKGWALYFNQRTKLSRGFKEKVVMISKYVCFSLLGKNKKIISDSFFPLLAILCWPLALHYKRKYLKKK